jgi:hypothetical protein
MAESIIVALPQHPPRLEPTGRDFNDIPRLAGLIHAALSNGVLHRAIHQAQGMVVLRTSVRPTLNLLHPACLNKESMFKGKQSAAGMGILSIF